MIIPQDVDSKTWLKFIGWYLTEGSCDRHGRQKISRVSISQGLMHPENRAEIVKILKEIGYTPYSGKESIEINAKALYDYVKQFGNSHKKNSFQMN